VGTTQYDPVRAYNGYVLYCPVIIEDQPSDVYLVNMSGAVVHQWRVPIGALRARLLPNGNLLVTGFNAKKKPGRPGAKPYYIGGATGWLLEVDWAGKEVFRHEDLNMHHDVARLSNGHYMYLAWDPVPTALRKHIRGGISNLGFPDGMMFNDRLVEIDGQGRTVWTWHANDHLNVDVDIIGPLYRRQEWAHCNSFSLLANGNILLTSRSTDSVMIVDRRTGAIVFRWGNGSQLNKATREVEHFGGAKYLGGPHDGREIPAGYPGAGHITVFNNRLNTGDFIDTQVIELDLKSREVVWRSPVNTLGRKQFSDYLGGAQKLPNGNMLVCIGEDGHFLQFTKDRKVVWEFINPQIPSPRFQGAVFKTECYAPDYCAQFKQLPPARGGAIGSFAAGEDAVTGRPATSAPEPSAAPVLSSPSVAIRVAAMVALGAILYLLRRRNRARSRDA
jgi:hypothetical protein